MALTTQTRRVRALEDGGGGSGGFPPCPECGGPAGPNERTTCEIVFDDEVEEEWCETCGRQTAFVIRWPEDLP